MELDNNKYEPPASWSLTPEFVQKHQPGFATPRILHASEHDGRMWSVPHPGPRAHSGGGVAHARREMETARCGAGGGGSAKRLRAGKGVVPEQYLMKYGVEHDYASENLRQPCEEMGHGLFGFGSFIMRTLAPGNIIVEDVPRTGSLGLIDWEIAGYFPRGWIRTNGLDLPGSGAEPHGVAIRGSEITWGTWV
ncbi:hypothetical protein P175DRAFT_0536249 [Aspergillus ochraceoroseus IBT 24754]|uniref:Aminoglycoside phosphotransferase domain-containing protein n=1 Tax=Aspergillus ochraceoroseus IBT 24754 TaxID=1392256 RepID=A0A2T5LL88_9EURO|nr:uncharacterized protein P175DRAFT_0536249 [Aspergillus ochraceoroseus IBT 24754]PTU17048.1 hypothetical protein P175DRAFT_0536249 [Aspergillus ochraceoroseus IBT 24754]